MQVWGTCRSITTQALAQKGARVTSQLCHRDSILFLAMLMPSLVSGAYSPLASPAIFEATVVERGLGPWLQRFGTSVAEGGTGWRNFSQLA